MKIMTLSTVIQFSDDPIICTAAGMFMKNADLEELQTCSALHFILLLDCV
jgi:hypothetical protein